MEYDLSEMLEMFEAWIVMLVDLVKKNIYHLKKKSPKKCSLETAVLYSVKLYHNKVV